MGLRKLSVGIAIAFLVLGYCWQAAHAQTVMRIGMNDDPDTIDPAMSPHAASRIILNAVCDKLFDIDKDLNTVHRLAESHQWSEDGLSLTVKLRSGLLFQDETPLDAKAVHFNLERSRLTPGSFRRTDLAIIDGVEIVDPLTVRIRLKAKSATLIAELSDNAGFMISPKAVAELGEKFGSSPVCAGPFKFVSRVAQDKVTFAKFDKFWDVKNIHIDRVEFTPIGDSSVRFAGLQAGDFDLLERMSPTDVPTVEKDSRLKLVRSRETGYGFMSFNVGRGPMAAIMSDKRVRQAINYAIDREVLARVAFSDQFFPGGQFFPPGSYYHNDAVPVPKRDVAKAKQLLKEAGKEKFQFELLTRPEREFLLPAQVIQAMLAEAGIDMLINVGDNVSQGAAARAGKFSSLMTFWSGRNDPDGNISAFFTCKASNSRGDYCNEKFDALLKEGRETLDPAKRKVLYNQVAAIFDDELPALLLWHRQHFIPMRANVNGFELYPDGMLRLRGVSVKR
jgi:peptide/nickel transport system substrate-binding protein